MLITKLLEVGELFPQYPTCPSFQSFCDKAERILWRIFEENVDMIGIDCDLDYLYIQFFAGLAKNTFHYHIPDQYLASVFRGKNHMIRQQRYARRDEVVSKMRSKIKFSIIAQFYIYKLLKLFNSSCGDATSIHSDPLSLCCLSRVINLTLNIYATAA